MNQTPATIDLARFDARDIPCRVKHGRIFQRWTELPVGAHFILINDHDPLPLYYQFKAQFPGAFSWEYLERGPEEFQVKITRHSPSTELPDLGAKPIFAIDPKMVLDLRPIQARLKLAQISDRWNSLCPGSHFILVDNQYPLPLRYQFEEQYPKAFSWEYLEMGPDVFQVKVTKLAPLAGGTLEVDARGLEPPEPLMRILNALETLPPDVTLRAITDREPCHLFAEAERRGFRTIEREARPDGSWLTLLKRA